MAQIKKTSEEIRQEYRDRLILPEICKENIIFYTQGGLEIAHNYKRVVVGDRGPYIEFEEDMMILPNIRILEAQRWRLWNALCFYIDYRSNDECFVKIYKQKRPVTYADYKIGLWYISPFDLKSDKYEKLVKEIK